MLNIIRFIKNKEKYKNLDERFKTIGITVSGFKYLKPSVWQDIYDALNDLLKKYSFVPVGYLSEIRAIPKNRYIQFTTLKNDNESHKNIPILETSLLPEDNEKLNYKINNVAIYINANYMRNVKKHLKAVIEPKNKTKYAIAHEFGHIIDFYLSIVMRFKDLTININYNHYKYVLSNFLFSKNIVDPVLLKNHWKYKDAAVQMKYLDPINSTEVFAETIALEYNQTHIELSNEVYNYFLNVIKR